MARAAAQHKIGQVVQSTGVSRELIHHYLRQGLLPRSSARARYSERQVRLLQLIKRLREDHGLPLDVIRAFFRRFDFDPELLEPLLLVESLGHRMTRYAERGELAPSRTLGLAELCAGAGVDEERVARYRELGLVRPLDGEERFSIFDAHIIGLVERGVALGIPLDSFRTIASYIRVAFQLEHGEVFDGAWDGSGELGQVLGQLFLRREVVGSFVQNVLQALIQRHVHRSLEQSDTPGTSVDAVVYQPSEAFLQRHGLQRRIEQRQEWLARKGWRAWLELAELLLHAGRNREAVFFLEQALERWVRRGELDALYGVALVLAGQLEAGATHLVAAARQCPDLAPFCAVHRGLALLLADGELDGAAIQQLALTGLDGLDPQGALPGAPTGWGLAVQLWGGFLLTALPPAFRRAGQGRAELARLLRRLEQPDRALRLPGLRQRYQINAAYLLLQQAGSDGEPEGLEEAALRQQICNLDPGSSFAEQVFLRASGAEP